MMAFNQPARDQPGMAIPDASSTSAPTTVLMTFAGTFSPSPSPTLLPRRLRDDPVVTASDLTQDNPIFVSLHTCWHQSLEDFGFWNLLLLLAYAAICAVIAFAAAEDHLGPKTGSETPETGRRADLQREGKHLAWAMAFSFGLLFTLPLVAVHLLLQSFAYVCLEVFVLAVRQKRRHGLLPLFYQSGGDHHDQRTQQQQRQRYRTNCGYSYSIDHSDRPSLNLAIRVLKKYVELPPLRFFLACLCYDPPSQTPSSVAPNDGYFRDWTTDASPPVAPSRQRRQERSQALQRWWTSQQDRRRLQRHLCRKKHAKKWRYSPTLPPVDESTELTPLMCGERPTLMTPTKALC